MDDARFGQVVAQYEKLVFTICYQFTRDSHTAEDLAQETFLSAYRHKEDCPEDEMKPWLARIATNKAKDYLKSAYHRRIQTPTEDTLPEQSGRVLYQSQSLPEDIALSRETVEEIADSIRALKEPYHQVACLYFLAEVPVETIAQRLGRPAKTVHTQLFRAKKILQQQWKGARGHGTVSK